LADGQTAGSSAGPAVAGGPAVAVALREAAELGGYFEISCGRAPPGGSFQLATTAYRRGLRGLVEQTGEAAGAGELRVAASTLHLGLAARLWSAPLACALNRGVVPDLRLLQVSDRLPLRLWLPASPAGDDPAGAGWLGADEQSLAGLLQQVVLAGQLAPLAAGLTGQVAAGLLRGNAASALIGALTVLSATRPDLADRARALAWLLLATPELAGSGALTGPGLSFRRTSCCLYYRVPGGGLCGDCSLR
jgi:hypothetical protein